MFTFEAHQSILILYFVFWNLDFVFSTDNLFWISCMHGKAFPQDSLEGRSFLSTYIRNSFSLLKHGCENKETIYNFEPETLRKITNNKNIK